MTATEELIAELAKHFAKLERVAEAGRVLAEAVEKSRGDTEWCADCLAKVDCGEALSAYRTAVKNLL